MKDGLGMKVRDSFITEQVMMMLSKRVDALIIHYYSSQMYNVIVSPLSKLCKLLQSTIAASEGMFFEQDYNSLKTCFGAGHHPAMQCVLLARTIAQIYCRLASKNHSSNIL